MRLSWTGETYGVMRAVALFGVMYCLVFCTSLAARSLVEGEGLGVETEPTSAPYELTAAARQAAEGLRLCSLTTDV